MKDHYLKDYELIQQTRTGDSKAFEKLVKRYESQVGATVIGILGKCEAADDVGQEVFIRFYKYLNNFREESALGTYLTRIAINLSLNELKRRKRRQFFFKKNEKDMNSVTVNPEDTITKSERKELVQNAIKKLAPEFRAVIVLRLIQGYSTKEVAEILNIPAGTVLSRLARAQKKLKQLLTPFIEEVA
ncbi:MAG: RNA polymerase sigma factor [bacterium]